MKRSTILLVLFLSVGPARAQGDLVVNGSFTQSPDPLKFVGVEGHAGAWVCRLPSSTTELANWAVSGRGVAVTVWKGNNRHSLQLNNFASVSQTIPTLAHRLYDVHVDYAGDGEGASEQKVDVQFGSEHRSISWKLGQTPQAYKPFDEQFRAGSSGTVLQLTGQTKGGSGMQIWKVSVTEMTSNTAATDGPLQKQYREMDGWATQATISDIVAKRVSEDFAGRDSEGGIWNHGGYLDYWHQLFEHHLNVATTVRRVVPEDHGATVTVDRHIWGDRTNRVTHWKDRWVKEGDEWTLKSSEQT